MLTKIREFFTKHIRYKRNEDSEIEEIWDLMICGHAKGLNPAGSGKRLLGLVLDLASIGLAFLGLCVIGFGTDSATLLLAFAAVMVVFPIMINCILRAAVKWMWLAVILGFVAAFLIGIVLACIGLAF